MQRWITFLVGAAVVVLAVVLMWKGVASTRGTLAADAGARATDAGAASAMDAESLETTDADTFLDFPAIAPIQPPPDGGIGWTMPDGTPVPPLPATAPKQVKIGGILIVYAGAELAPKGSKSKATARELADKTAADAKSDFHAAVVRGEQGFAFDEIGIIYRGSLEPAVEYVIFNLAPGTVSDVIDTPRGFWIVKRIE
jgi:hypothetical protein